jgi:hypothetical protein
MKIGVISDLNHTESPAYASYYYAIKNLHSNVSLVHKKEDLRDIDILICGNDHHAGHLQIWSDASFTDEVNKKKIPFFVHTVEHIRSPSYPWNVDIQSKLKRYTDLRQRCWDIGDTKEQGTKLARVLLSRNFQNFDAPAEKLDSIMFIGTLHSNRVKTIEELSKHIKVHVAPRSALGYKDFLSNMARFKYVLSPISNGVNGIPGRFYEALTVRSIPVQEVYEDTLEHYSREASISGCVFFRNVEECIYKLENNNLQPPTEKMFLEDELKEFLNDFGVEVKL